MRARGVAAVAAALALGAASGAAALEGEAPRARPRLSASAAYERGLALDLAGRYAEALPHYEEAARLSAEVRARYHRKLSRGVLEGLRHLKRFPQDGRALFSVGVDAANKVTALRRETGVVVRTFYAIAEEALRKSMRLLPTMNDPAICLAGLYADAGEPARARETLALTRGRSFNQGETYNLACYYHSMGRYEDALGTLAKVMNDHYRRWILESDDFWRLRGDPRLEAMLRGRAAP